MYKTVSSQGEFEQVINRSTFIAKAFHADNEAEAKQIIAKVKKLYPDARHCCWAYILGENKNDMRYGDDGEPQGTAGLPMLEVLRKKDVTNVVVTVTRYFGGILLGAGGLSRAYSSSAAGALDNAGIAEMIKTCELDILTEYPLLSRLKNILGKTDCIIKNIEYSETVTVIVLVKSDLADDLVQKITDALSGKCSVLPKNQFYFPWE